MLFPKSQNSQFCSALHLFIHCCALFAGASPFINVPVAVLYEKPDLQALVRVFEFLNVFMCKMEIYI